VEKQETKKGNHHQKPRVLKALKEGALLEEVESERARTPGTSGKRAFLTDEHN